ncbi:uncharacterized protein LOC125660074 [Ostrea edulis]|uniref:uncharacterized protein LOC125660074 n=1 Tax=Ostrea edulis TaxID=37623 RepID=UPI0024AEF762|nr:uncharacterized protein LOC125660074 [Ostrea edulis]
MPRRKADQSGGKGQMAKSKGPKRPRTGQVPMMEAAVPSASQSLVDIPQPTIDYAKLATEILKQQAVQQGANADIPTPQSQAMSIRVRWQQKLTNLVTQIFEGEPAGTLHNPNMLGISITDGIPLGASTPSKIKTIIWANEFIDLRCLLLHQEEDPVTLFITPGIINFQHSQKSKTPLSINQWTDAFLVFKCIILQKDPTQAPHLLKYMAFIRELQKLHGDAAWRAYDESFRNLRESVNLPWQKPVEELRGRAVAMSSRNSFGQPFWGKQAGKVGGVKFCYAYNQGNKCKTTPCPFTHICQNCKGQHPKIKCKAGDKTEYGSHTSNTSKGRQVK